MFFNIWQKKLQENLPKHVIGGILLATLPASVALAQLDEIVVTAERLEADIQKVPVAVTALSADDIEARQVRNVLDLNASVPGLYTSTNTSTADGARIFLRGIGEDESRLSDPAVGVYIDGVYIGRIIGSLFDLIDTESIEVLRGPQGTLYGRNTNGGAIKINSKKPEPGETSYQGALTVGTEGEQKLVVSGNFGVSDNTAISVALSQRQRDDLWTNTTDNDEVGEKDTTAARLALNTSSANGWDYLFSFDMSQSDSDPIPPSPITDGQISDFTTSAGFGLGPPLTSTNTSDNLGISLGVNGDVGDWALGILVASREYENELNGQVGGLLYAQSIDQDQTTLEVTLQRSIDNFNLLGGIYTYQEEFNFPYNFAGFYAPEFDQETTAQSLFGQVKYTMGDMTFTGGVRQTSEDKDVAVTDTIGAAGRPQLTTPSVSFDNTSYKLSVDRQINDDLMVFASVATGFKSGGWSPDNYSAVDEETVATWEVGVRSEFGNTRLNATYFFNNYEDLQISATRGGSFTRFNVPETEISGLEIEFNSALSESVSLYGNYSSLDGEYTEMDEATALALLGSSDGASTNANCVGAQGDAAVQCALGLDLKSAPENKVLIGLNYDLDTRWVVDVQAAYEDASHALVANPAAVEVPDHTVVNASVKYSIPNSRYSLTLWGKNITDEEYWTASSTTFGNWGYLADPATYGVTLSGRF